MSRLFRAGSARPDARPALMAVVSLMLMLLPMLLANGARVGRSGIGLAVPAGGERPPLPHTGPVQALRVLETAQGFVIEADVRATDVRASSAPTALRREEVSDLAGLQAALLRIKALDPVRTEAVITPLPDTRTEALVQLLDAVASVDGRALFPDRVLRGAGP